MSADENELKWNKFLEIGNNIHKMRGQVRILEAKRALVFAKQLIENEFIPNLPIKDQQLYETLLPKIACYLDGNTEVIQDAVREYFLIRHCKAGLDENLFQVSFSPKKSGIQTGFTCDISDGSRKIRFYIKTHQYGPTESNPLSVKPPDTKELFIYQLLQHIGIGPEVHFIVPSHGSKITIYIATKDCHLTLLSKLANGTANTEALVQLDLDFRIEKQSGGYFKSDIVDRFYQGNGEFNYTGLMAEAVGIPQAQKLHILKESLRSWNLLETIDRTVSEIRQFIQKISTKIQLDDDLQRYFQDVKATINILSQV
jgi:hypothetical protein